MSSAGLVLLTAISLVVVGSDEVMFFICSAIVMTIYCRLVLHFYKTASHPFVAFFVAVKSHSQFFGLLLDRWYVVVVEAAQ